MRTTSRTPSLFIALVTFLAAPASAHPPGPDGKHEDHDQAPSKQAAPTMPPEAKLPKGLVLPAIEGPKPWTDKPTFDDPDRFQIVIMTDNTGGHRPGVWMKAVEKVNLMKPHFVMSVGDLIEGYSTDRAKVEAEWKEFLGFMDKMDMKFFFVAGNHDVTNPLMHEIWREHFGPVHYSFDYKGVHFLCLNSEDPESKIGEEQLAWLAKDLEKAKDARWTLVFLHKPLWVESERALTAGNADKTNWKQVEKMLGERPHTVFSGHVHYYAQYDRNGRKYYHLATTGGSSPLRGVPYGEFDQIAWLTMEKDGPTVANLLLDGILPGDVVTEKSIGRFRQFLEKTQVEVAPILIDDDGGLSQGRIDLRLVNRFDTPVELSATIAGLPLRGLTVEPETLKLSAQPGKTAELAVNVRFADKVAFSHLAQTLLTASLKTTDKDRPLSAERTVPVVIDRKFLIARAKDLTIDGKLTDWPAEFAPMPTPPLVLGRSQDWQNTADAGIAIAAAHDDKFLYLAAKVSDERVLPTDDEITFRLDARPMLARRNDPRQREGTYHIRATAPSDEGKSNLRIRGSSRARIPEGAKHAAIKRDGGYDVELAIPLEIVKRHQPNWQSTQITAIVNDVDEEGKEPARVVWRGSNDVDERNSNYGQFLRSE